MRVVRWWLTTRSYPLSIYMGRPTQGTPGNVGIARELLQKKVTVVCPGIVHIYNTNMGAVDSMDSCLGLYRMFFRGNKWYLRIFFHIMDMAVINAWLLNRRDFVACAKPQ